MTQLHAEQEHAGVHHVEVTVGYLPAAHPFHESFSPDATLEDVRVAAMTFFGVHDFKDRDEHKFWLEFDGQRITNTAQTLRHLLGEDRRGVRFELVGEVIQG